MSGKSKLLILMDTNVLVYAINVDASRHEPSRALVEAVREKRVNGVIVPQILLEFYAVITDRRRTRGPLDPQTAWNQIDVLRTIFPVLEGGSKALGYLREFSPSVKGADVFDAFLVAQMKACGLSVLCTYNTKDFTGYEGIVIQTPEAILVRV